MNLSRYIRAGLQLKYQIQALQWQIKNSTGLNGYEWQDIQNLITSVNQLSQQGEALSYANNDVNQKFQAAYPNYQVTPLSPSYAKTTQTWQGTTLQTLQNSVAANHAIAEDFKAEHALLNQLKSQGQQPQGHLQALQTLNEITTENVNQLEELKRVELTQSNSENAYFAYRVSEESVAAKGLARFSEQISGHFPSYHGKSSLGLIPNF